MARRAAAGLRLRGRDEDARRELERIVAELDRVPRDFFWLTTMAAARARRARSCAHAESAEVLYETLAPYAGCMVQVGYAGSLGPVSRLLGPARGRARRPRRRRRHLESALAMTEATGLRLFETQARAELEELATASA